jgi:methyltransferase (TIGR00027 family)
MTSGKIENVSDTALWVAMYRAMETARPDAIFRDPFAEMLAGARGKAIVDAMPKGKQMAWPMIVRTAVMDEIISAYAKNNEVDLVVNLAAGLDARPWRLDVPANLRWVDVDLPQILEYKTGLMRDVKPICRYEAVPMDLRDQAKRQALFSQLANQSTRALVVAEGLLVYLSPENVASLSKDLHEAKAFRWWLIDIASPRLLKMMLRMWGKTMGGGNAPFLFAPKEDTKFFGPFGWKEIVYRSTGDEAARLKREMKGMWFWKFLLRFYPKRIKEQFKRFSGIVVLERT